MNEEIRKFILNEILRDPEMELADDEDFISNAVIDSTEILKIVNFVEEKFGVKADNSEINPGNFGSINNIVNFIQRKK